MAQSHETADSHNLGQQLNGLMFLETLKEKLPYMDSAALDGLADLLEDIGVKQRNQEDRISAIRELASRLRDCGFSCVAEWKANQN